MRYIDTEICIIILSERVGKCNRLDTCGYHYTPKQYFTDNPLKRDWECENVKYIGKFTYSHSHTPPPRPICTILMFEFWEFKEFREFKEFKELYG